MNVLKMFGITTLSIPVTILILSAIAGTLMPIGSIITLTIMFAVPLFVLITILRGIFKLIKVVWR